MLADVVAFCAVLREEHGFRVGPAESRDAVLALAAVGVGDVRRVRRALRLVCCASRDERARFDTAFDAFFLQRELVEVRIPVLLRSEVADAAPGERWRALQAKYSPTTGRADESPEVARDVAGDFGRAASRLVASLRRGRSRRWHPELRGARLDTRRTLRASLRTSGDPVVLRRLDHPRRNPRVVLILDGSRSMAEFAPVMLGFGEALVRRSPRARVLLFSTEVRDVTRELRAVHRVGARALADLGGAWGGGTRIGAALWTFARGAGSRWLSPDATVIVYSDGLDTGGGAELERALHAMRRSGAELIWLHPHAGAAGFVPATHALRLAAPFVGAFVGARDVRALLALPQRIAAARSRRSPT